MQLASQLTIILFALLVKFFINQFFDLDEQNGAKQVVDNIQILRIYLSWISDEDEVELWRWPIPMINVFRLGTMMLGFLDRENDVKIGSTKILYFTNSKGMFHYS